MKILLVTPFSRYSATRWIPLGLGYISSLLKINKHAVKLYDRFLKSYLLKDRESINQDMKSEILKFNPDIIGFSTISPVIYDTVECVEYVRGFYDGIIIAGGHHATALPELSLQKIPGLDFVAAGESEYTMLSLAEGNDPLKIQGLFSKHKDTSSFKPHRAINLDELPLPDYKIFDMNHFTQANRFTINGFYLKTASVISSRGCPNNCKFCSESLTYGNGVRYHGADYVIENIEKLATDYKIQGVYFHDNNFLASRSHAESICRKMIRSKLSRKIKWAIQAGTSTVDGDILQLLAEAGCIKIEFGMESIKDSDLRGLKKNTSAHLNETVLALCKKNRIRAHSYFMTGFEGENISDLNNTLRWIKKFKPHTFSLHQIKIYPGTQLYEISGNKFFENNEWDRSNIENYFNTEKFSDIGKTERDKWYPGTYKAFHSRYNKKAMLKTNSLASLFKMALLKYFKGI